MLRDNPRGAQAVEISSSFCAIAVFVVLLRLYTRLFIVRCPGAEDFLIAAAMLCSVGLTVCIGIQAVCGMGMHYNELEGNDFRRSLQAFYASLIVYYLSLGFIKASILLQYRRVFTTGKFQVTCWAVLAVVIVYHTWAVFGSIFICTPIRSFWAKDVPGKCLNQYAMWFTNASVNITTDFIIILLPMPVIKRLNLARRQKQALIGIFAVGGFVCVVSIMRLHSLVAISNSTDPTYDNPPAATWSSVETSVGIICSCLPCLRPLITHCLPGVFSSASRSTPKNGASTVTSIFSRSMARRRQSQGWTDAASDTASEHEGMHAMENVNPAICGAGPYEHASRVEREGSIVVTTEVRVRVNEKEKELGYVEGISEECEREFRRGSADSLVILGRMINV